MKQTRAQMGRVTDPDQLEHERDAKLEELEALLAEYMVEWEDPANQKDISENSPRDILRQNIQDVESQIRALKAEIDYPYIPGAWNLGDKIWVTYKKVVVFGKEQVVDDRVLVELRSFVDITELPKDYLTKQDFIIPLDSTSDLGSAIIGKAHKSIRFKTDTGYCEVELERCLV